MSLSWKDWKRNDLIYGVIVPLVVVLIIVGLSLVSSFLMRSGGFGGSYGPVIGIISAIEELVVTVAVPLMLGLVWNEWAGGASGFLMGSVWSIWYAVKYGLYAGSRSSGGVNLGPSLLGWMLSAMLIGYMAGVLNKHSDNLRRMLVVGMSTTAVSGFFLLGMFQLSPSNVVSFDFYGFAFNVAPRIAGGAVVAVLAKVFMWYGVAFHKATNQPKI